ncbi:hypothetical protein KCU83_g556, partial [Aureobasidium melanogenum]
MAEEAASGFSDICATAPKKFRPPKKIIRSFNMRLFAMVVLSSLTKEYGKKNGNFDKVSIVGTCGQVLVFRSQNATLIPLIKENRDGVAIFCCEYLLELVSMLVCVPRA